MIRFEADYWIKTNESLNAISLKSNYTMMRWYLVLLLICSILLWSCSDLIKQNDLNKEEALTYSYQVSFHPSFMPPCVVAVKATDYKGVITLTNYKETATELVTSSVDSALLAQDDVKFLDAGLSSIPLFEMITKESTGTDGITVENVVSRGQLENKFSFWSPSKSREPQQHRIVEVILGLSRRKFTTLKHQEYFESLEQYFDFGLPCKIISTSPFEVRIYGSLSSDVEKELKQFVHNLPSDKPIVMDLTNFEGMGTMYYPLFKSLVRRNNKVFWVPSKYGREQLLEMGIPQTRLVGTFEEGRQRIKLGL